MYREFLSSSAHLLWPQFALALFFLTFVVVVVRALRRRSGAASDALAALPLRDDDAYGGAYEGKQARR